MERGSRKSHRPAALRRAWRSTAPALYVCDLKEAAVFRLDLRSRALSRFTPPGIRPSGPYVPTVCRPPPVMRRISPNGPN